jgi:hypothetical protein
MMPQMTLLTFLRLMVETKFFVHQLVPLTTTPLIRLRVKLLISTMECDNLGIMSPTTAGETAVEADEVRVEESPSRMAGDVITSQDGNGDLNVPSGGEVDGEDAGYDTDISDDSIHADGDVDLPGDMSAVPEVTPQPVVEVLSPPTYSADASGRVLRPRRSDWKSGPWQARVYETGLHITVKKAMTTYPSAAKAAMRKEIGTILRKRVTKPVLLSSLSASQKRSIIRSSLFLKEKYLSTGEFDLLKARLVAGGNMQDRSVYSEGETSSPTVAISSAYMLMAIAAHKHRKVATMDVGGAYLNAVMEKDVFMRVDPSIVEVFIELDPSYSKALNPDGSIFVKLKKALYGCIESSKLWYDNLSSKLLNLGFVKNEKDHCVFNVRRDNGYQLTVAIYVDDLFCSSVDDSALEWIITESTDAYKELSVHRGGLHSYPGHTLDFESSPGKVKLTMEGYIRDLLHLYEVRGVAASPATSDLFSVVSDEPRLSPELK